MLLGKEQAFGFLIAQHKLIKASQEQTDGKTASGQTIVNVEIGLAIQQGFGNWKLFQPGFDRGLRRLGHFPGKLHPGMKSDDECHPLRFRTEIADHLTCLLSGIHGQWFRESIELLLSNLPSALLGSGEVAEEFDAAWEYMSLQVAFWRGTMIETEWRCYDGKLVFEHPY